MKYKMTKEARRKSRESYKKRQTDEYQTLREAKQIISDYQLAKFIGKV